MLRTLQFMAVLTAMFFLILPAKAEGSFEMTEREVFIAFSGISVDNMPLEIRNVPIHPDDSGTPGPIAQTKYGGGMRLGFAATFHGIEWNSGQLKPRLRWQYSINGPARRNYTNAPDTEQRGYGAALTYLTLRERALPTINGSDWLNSLTNLYPEVVYARDLISDTELEISVGYFRLIAETGWDRYDSFEPRKGYNLANCFPVTATLHRDRVKLGLCHTIIMVSDRSDEMQVNSGISTTVAYQF